MRSQYVDRAARLGRQESVSYVRLLWADPQHVFDLLCIKAGRNLSLDEWRTYVGADEPWRPTCPHWRNAEAPVQAR